MSPTAGVPSQSSPVRVAPPLAQTFELRCAEVHPVGCAVELRSTSPEDVLLLACEHGTRAHGFTPAFYSSERLAAMATKVTRSYAGIRARA